jgi:hypothetical protein
VRKIGRKLGRRDGKIVWQMMLEMENRNLEGKQFEDELVIRNGVTGLKVTGWQLVLYECKLIGWNKYGSGTWLTTIGSGKFSKVTRQALIERRKILNPFTTYGMVGGFEGLELVKITKKIPQDKNSKFL